MAKKSKDHKANRGNKGNKEIKGSSSVQGHGQKFDHGKDFSNEGDMRQMSQGEILAGSQNDQGLNLPEMQESPESQGIDLPEILTTKKSCLPKLVVLLMPFVAIGAYFFLGR